MLLDDPELRRKMSKLTKYRPKAAELNFVAEGTSTAAVWPLYRAVSPQNYMIPLLKEIFRKVYFLKV